MSGSTNDSNVLSDLPTLRRDAEAQAHPEPPHKRKRFSSESANDLIFFAVQLCVLAIGLAIVWAKIEQTNRAVLVLIKAQEQEILIARKQADEAHDQAVAARAAEHTRAIQLGAATNVMQGVLDRVNKVQNDVISTLDSMRSINENVLIVSKTVLDVSNQTKAASIHASNAATIAAGAARSAAGAAGAAASQSIAARALVRSKVATTADKVRIDRETAALVAKRAQLNKAIKQVKKKGPTPFQKLFQ